MSATIVWNYHTKQALSSSHPVLTKPSWPRILKETAKGLRQIHPRGISHNDLKSNNVVLEKQKDYYNPVIIDFGKSWFIGDSKQVMSLSASGQTAYWKRCRHITPKIVYGRGTQSVASDIFYFGKWHSTCWFCFQQQQQSRRRQQNWLVVTIRKNASR